MSVFRLRPGRSAGPRVAAAASRQALPAPPPANVLTVLGRDQVDFSSSAASFAASRVAPYYADAVLVLPMGRANGASQAYSPALTVDGSNATLLGGNHAAATADFDPLDLAFLYKAAFKGGSVVAFALAMSGSVRPSGWDIVWLAGTRAQTALGASVFPRGTTSTSSLSTTLTPTSTDSLVFLGFYGVFGAGGVTVSSLTPALGTRLADRTVGNTLGVGALQYHAPASTSQISPAVGWSASSSSRGGACVEIVR